MAAIGQAISMFGGTALRQKAALDEHKETQRQMAKRVAELERDSKTAYAIAQREGKEEIRKAKLISSRATALAAFSGAGASDDTVLNIIADIEGEGEYRRSIALYRGKQESAKLTDQAQETRRAKEAEQKAYKYKQMGIILSMGQSMGSAYGNGSYGGGSTTQASAPKSGGQPYTGWV